MGRIIRKTPYEAYTSETITETPPDTYFDKLVKVTPGYVIALVTFVQGLIFAIPHDQEVWGFVIVVIGSLVMVWLADIKPHQELLEKMLKSKEEFVLKLGLVYIDREIIFKLISAILYVLVFFVLSFDWLIKIKVLFLLVVSVYSFVIAQIA